MTDKELKQDQQKLEKMLLQARAQLQQAQINVYRLEGALNYVTEQIKKEVEVEDDKE